MSNINADFGNHASQIIRQKGLTKREISERSGIPYSTLNAVLKGYRAVTLDFIVAIAEAIDKKPSSLLPATFLNTGSNQSKTGEFNDEP